MANIYLKKRRDPIEISNTRAQVLKQQWMNDKVPRSTIIDLDSWAGEIGEIKGIEITEERRYAHDDYYKPPTDQQRKTTTQSLEQLGDWVKRQKWYKEKIDERHYSEEHARQHCHCTRPENWIDDSVEKTQVP